MRGLGISPDFAQGNVAFRECPLSSAAFCYAAPDRIGSMAKQPKKAGPVCPKCNSREVAVRAFSSKIKNAIQIGILLAGKTTYRWRCEKCGHKFTTRYP